MSKQCYHFQFILFVTGKGEKEHLPKLFSKLSSSSICTFTVREFLDQRRPITSQNRIARMTRTGQKLPTKDFERIGAPARRYINDDQCNRVLLIDDLEEISKEEAVEKFRRYRAALDAALDSPDRRRASVHFLVNMLEAYFFAQPDAINVALELETPIPSQDIDVESIRNPKSRLRQLFPAYNEIEHAALILDLLELDTILANSIHCSALRTCVKWIVDQLREYPDQAYFDSLTFEERFHLHDGALYEVTKDQ